MSDGGPAFPCKGAPLWRADIDGRIEAIPDSATDLPGMSIRDWFAGQALAPCLKEIFTANQDDGISYSDLMEKAAECVYELADAMLRARENKT